MGPYEIATQIGAGGMGEVYQALDTRLDRRVALKILPDLFAADPERLARFEREARTLAALNHPHIAQIYGVEESTSVRALVMELVDGPTLAERIAEGAIPLDEALTIARQISAALEAAHEQGIIHRDLKPANIKVTPDGVVKVLDFGLAKLLDADQSSSAPDSPRTQQSMSPTITNAMMTGAGVILGTAAYMSPEQARGRAADKRSDIWAFGAVLFEMLSGRRTFEGEDASETLAFVLTKSPDWTLLPAAVPQSVRTLLRRCLERDRRKRITNISTASFVLEEVSSGTAIDGESEESRTERTRSAHKQIEAAVAATRREMTLRRVLPITAAMLLLASLAGVVAWTLKPSPSPTVYRFAFTPAQALATARQAIAVSPDGRRVAYIARQGLYVQELSELEPREVPGIVNAQTPVFSPTGDSIAFYTVSDNTVKRVPVSGGGAVTVCRATNPSDLFWDSSGIIFVESQSSAAGSGPGAIVRCPANGGEAETLVRPKNNDELWQGPQLLPGGRSLIFAAWKRSYLSDLNYDKAEIVLYSLSTGTRKTLLAGGSDVRYLPTGHLLYAVSGRMLAVPFDAEQEAILGSAVSVVDGVRRSLSTGAAHLAISNTGTLVYVPGSVGPTGATKLAIADRAGTVTPLAIDPGPYIEVRAPRDGRQLAITSDDGKEAFISIYDVAGTSAMRRLTLGGRSRFPVWSPDGQHVAYQSDREGDLAIFAQRADGTGPVKRLTKPAKGDAHIPESWAPPDGRHMSFAVTSGSGFALWTLSVADGKVAPFHDVRSLDPIGSAFSRDGQWLAYHLNIGAAAQSSRGAWVHRFPTGERYLVPKVILDFHPVWSLNSSELYFVPSAQSGQMAVTQVSTAAGATFSNPQTFPARITGNRIGTQPRAYDVLPNGKFVGLASSTGGTAATDAAPSIRVVVNWFEELKARVPTK